MDTVELSVLREPESGAGTGAHHQEKPADVEKNVAPGIYSSSSGIQILRYLTVS